MAGAGLSSTTEAHQGSELVLGLRAAWVLGRASSWSAPAMPSQLFDFIAQCVRQFLAGIGNPQHSLPLGFVFPFDCKQTRLDKVSGTALSWGCGCGHLLPLLSSSRERSRPGDGGQWSATCSPQAELVSWSKGFSCSDVEGKDVVELLQLAIDKQEVEGWWGGGLAGGCPHEAADDALALPGPALPCASCRPVE